MKYIKWGVLGYAAQVHSVIRMLGEFDGSQVVAVMGGDVGVSASDFGELGIKCYSDAQGVIDDAEVNAVYISTSPSTHATYAILSMRSGKPVFVAAPLADSYWDCVRMNRVSEESGVSCFANYYFRYSPYYNMIRERLRDDVFGRILGVELRCIGGSYPDFFTSDGDGFWSLCAYHIDVLQHLFGVITDVWGVNGGGDNVNALSACFKFASGVPGSALWVHGTEVMSGGNATLCYDDIPSGGGQSVGLGKLRYPAGGKDWSVLVIGERARLRFSLLGEGDVMPGDDVNVNADASPASGQGASAPTWEELSCRRLLGSVIGDLQGFGVCDCTSVSATAAHWVIDRLRGE